jgi:hypothetical protein
MSFLIADKDPEKLLIFSKCENMWVLLVNDNNTFLTILFTRLETGHIGSNLSMYQLLNKAATFLSAFVSGP